MKLKRLEVVGFKSFGDRMEFEFGSGLTGVVGPNGCGKSNVVDAIRWVLGEQRPTQLRGSEMLDVIFKGAASRAAAGFAEVTVVLDNESGELATDYSEVSFTRRLFRTGESEYLLNRQPARLRDIRELLLDTGLGVHSYTILEQGKIDAVLSANPLERRMLFEEAAGISKFKLRRKEAYRKMEQVHQNLLRIYDLLKELESGIRSLKIQATKARKYEELTGELREKKISLALFLYTRHSVELEQARNARIAHEDQGKSLRKKREEIDASVNLLQEEQEIQESEIAREQSGLEEVKQSEVQAAERISTLKVRIAEWAREKTSALERIQVVERNIQEKQLSGENLLAELEATRESLAALQRGLEAKRNRSEFVGQEFKEVALRLNEIDKLVMQLLQGRAETQNILVDGEALLRSLKAEAERRQARYQELITELNSTQSNYKSLKAEADTWLTRENKLTQRQLEIKERAHSYVEELAAKEKQLSELEHKISAMQSKYQLLRELAQAREGLDYAAQTLLENHQELSLLADHIQVELRYARALETALAHRAQCLVVLNPSLAKEFMDQLRSKKQGRAAFAINHNVALTSSVQIPQVPGVMSRLLDVVRVQEQIRPLLERWIGNCVLVENAERGRALAEHHPHLQFLTQEGDLFSHDLWVGGEEAKETGLISRRSLMEAIEGELKTLCADRDLFALSLGELQRQLSQLRAEEETLLYEQRNISREVAGKNAALQQIGIQLHKDKEEIALLETELQQYQKEITQKEILVQQATGKLQNIQVQFERANEQLRQLQMQKAAKENERQEGFRQESDLRLEVEKLRGVEQNFVKQRELLAKNLHDLEQDLSHLKQAIRQIEERTDLAKQEIEALHHKRTEQLEERSLLEKRLQDLRARLEVLSDKIEARRHELHSKTNEFEELLRLQSEAKLAEQKIELTRDEIANRIREEFALELSQLIQERQVPQDFPQEVTETEIDELKVKISRLGSINLDAIRELEEKDSRFQFLNSQKTDLEESKRLLQETIRKIDVESRERFAETFERAKEQFQLIFRQLFRGGKAELTLQEGVDMLEAGIVIQARPPGKELRNIDLLSGGERTLTALALLFALFRLKPGPFCVLDEVDAALDDANVERFLRVLDEFTHESQFIIVTHNKMTMGACNLLYGITMQDNGISKRVAVELGASESDGVRLVSEENTFYLPQNKPKVQEVAEETGPSQTLLA